jgi:hypothetical protein
VAARKRCDGLARAEDVRLRECGRRARAHRSGGAAEGRPDEGDGDDQRREVEPDGGEASGSAKQPGQRVSTLNARVDRSYGGLLCAAEAMRKHVVCTLRAVRRERTRWEEDNEAPVNVAAFVTVALVALAIAGLIVLLELT